MENFDAMKKPLFLLLCLSVMPAMSQDARRLAALSQIESGDNDRAVGKDGEVSRYQIARWFGGSTAILATGVIRWRLDGLP